MSNQQYNAPPVAQYPTPGNGGPIKPAPQGNGLGVAALVVGVVAIVLSIIPLLGMVAFVLGPIALILGLIGVFLKNRKKGMAITGVILGALSMIIAGVITAGISAGVDAIDESLNAEHAVEYVVTTNGPASVSYWDGDGSSNADITENWESSFTADAFSMISLTVTGDFMDDAASVSCEILVDGESVSKNTGEGSAAMASCSAATFTDGK